MVTVEAMKNTNKELKKQYGKLDIDKIESVHYDMQDLLEQANEVQEVLGRSYNVPDELDEEELEAELAALADEEEEGESYLDSVITPSQPLDTSLLEELEQPTAARPVPASGSY